MKEPITKATIITLTRIVFVPVFIVIALVSFKSHFLVAGLLYTILAITDSLDGYIARKTNTVTNLGKLLDPIADKAISISGMICGLISGIIHPQYISIAFVTIMILREILVSWMRSVVLKKGYVLAADGFGKFKTIFVNIAIPVMYLGKSLASDFSVEGIFPDIFKYLGSALFFVAFVLTVISGVRYFYINRKIIKESLSKQTVSEADADNNSPIEEE